MISNVPPLSIRMNRLLLRHSTHPLSKSLAKYHLNYNKIITQNNNKNKYVFQSPFYRAEYIIDSKYPTSISSITKVIRNHPSFLPCYSLKQSQQTTLYLCHPKISQLDNSLPNFHVDGPCNPKPGMGSHSWYPPFYNYQHCLSQVKTYEFSVSINKCEVMAIVLLLKYLNKNPPINPQIDHTINIYSDSLTILRYLTLHSYPKYNDLKQVIERCLRILLSIQGNHKNIHINLIKVKSHADIPGNNEIDKLAQNKTKIPYYNSSKTKLISYPVSLRLNSGKLA